MNSSAVSLEQKAVFLQKWSLSADICVKELKDLSIDKLNSWGGFSVPMESSALSNMNHTLNNKSVPISPSCIRASPPVMSRLGSICVTSSRLDCTDALDQRAAHFRIYSSTTVPVARTNQVFRDSAYRPRRTADKHIYLDSSLSISEAQSESATARDERFPGRGKYSVVPTEKHLPVWSRQPALEP